MTSIKNDIDAKFLSPNLSIRYNKASSELSTKNSIYHNIDRINYQIKKDVSPFNDSNSSSISRYEKSIHVARRRNNFLSTLINSR